MQEPDRAARRVARARVGACASEGFDIAFGTAEGCDAVVTSARPFSAGKVAVSGYF